MSTGCWISITIFLFDLLSILSSLLSSLVVWLHNQGEAEKSLHTCHILSTTTILCRDSLSSSTSKDEQWHNDVLGQKAADTLKALRFDHINAVRFVNLRCTLFPGCPVGINPLDPTEADIRNKYTRAFFAGIYMELLNVSREQVPRHIGNVCCAQFAVTRTRIQTRPKSDYERMLKWADQSQEVDFGVGRVFEKLWDIIFGMDAINCPNYEQCRCDLYGWCGPLASGEVLIPKYT
ncbi:hypothetical protein E4T42_02782 [Aureobasidium subglaciale]|nr:hypothetical protein E4T42_02782 [Aureobasidium subglaciale]